MRITPDHEYTGWRFARWVFFFPAMYAVAFCSGIVIMNETLMLLIPALVGVAIAPRFRIVATGIAFLYGNYLYHENLDFSYEHHNFGFWEAVKFQFPIFALPAAITVVCAIIMDLYTWRTGVKRRAEAKTEAPPILA